jgi:hypothetical protein
MSHLTIDTTLILAAKTTLSKDVAKLAAGDVYGLNICDKTWGAAYAKQLIIDALECDAVEEALNQSEVNCLQGKLSEDLVSNCC